MPTTNAGAFNIARATAILDASGAMLTTLVYTNATTGSLVCSRTLYVPSDSSKPITDQNGNVINATIANGAAANKLNL